MLKRESKAEQRRRTARQKFSLWKTRNNFRKVQESTFIKSKVTLLT